MLFACIAAGPLASAQADPPIPNGDIRIHYFRQDGNYRGWTVYAFFDTTEPNNFPGGPVPVTGMDDFGAYFDVGVTANASNVGLILHNGNVKDPGPNQYVNLSTQGREFWELSGSDVLSTTQPPTGRDPPIAAGHARIRYFRPDGNYANWVLYTYVSGNPTVFLQPPTAAQLVSGPFHQLQADWIDATTIDLQPAFSHAG